MSVVADWIAVDWGTSNLRVWAMGEDGAMRAAAGSDQGMGQLAPDAFETALLALIAPWLKPGRVTDVIACGMVGARQGWVEAGYEAVPAKPYSRVVRAPVSDDRIRVHVLAGISQTNPPDVMRGEETQIAGLLLHAPEFRGVACLPGTHTKWVQVVGGEVFHFASFMTGELFALLEQHSVLRHSLTGAGWDEAAFATALGDAMARPERVAARLFSLRAESLLSDLKPEAARARLSGLLIGIELAGARPYWLGQDIALIGDVAMTQIYRGALAQLGVTPTLHDATQLVLDGLRAAYAELTGIRGMT